MNASDLLQSIISAEKKDETTYSGAIAAAPAQVGVVEPAPIYNKGKKKKKRKVEDRHLSANEMVSRFTDKNMNESQLQDAVDGEIEDAIDAIAAAFSKLISSDEAVEVNRNYKKFIETFDGKDITGKKVVIRFADPQADLDVLKNGLTDTYRDDLGTLEHIMSMIEDNMALNSIDYFQDYDFLTGGSVAANYKGIDLNFHADVDFAYIPKESLVTKNERLLEALKNTESVKVVNNVVFPVGAKFGTDFFENLKDGMDKIVTSDKGDS